MATFLEILQFVSEFSDVPTSDILGKCREAPIAKARAQVAWLTRQLTDLSYPEIGRSLNCVHSSIIAMVQGIEADADERGECDNIREALLEIDECAIEFPDSNPPPVAEPPQPAPLADQSCSVTDYLLGVMRRRLEATWATKPGVGVFPQRSHFDSRIRDWTPRAV